MQAYGAAYARVYDLRWGEFSERIAPALAEVLPGEGSRVLDLCCGAGHLAALLATQGRTVVGLDASAPMLEHARARTAGLPVDLVLADATDFALDAPVDAAVSVYDALNHLPDLDALSRCFGCVRRVLRPGGPWVFDLNTAAFLDRWNGVWVDEDDELTLIRRGLYPDDRGRAWVRLSGFVRTDQGWERFAENVYNTPFPVDEVVQALHQRGFEEVCCAVLPHLDQPVQDPAAHKRVFFVAR